MKIVYMVGKRPDHTRHVRPAFMRPGDSCYTAIVYECELHKETPKGWKLRPTTANRKEPYFWSASDYYLFESKAAAAEYVRGQLESARDVLMSRIQHLDHEIKACLMVEAGE